MPAVLKAPALYQSTNFTAEVGGRYAVRTTEAFGLTMTLPDNPGTGAVVLADYTYGTGTFAIARSGSAQLFTNGNPYGADFSGVNSISFDGDNWVGFTFICVFDGTNWTIGLGLSSSWRPRFRDYILLDDAEIYMDVPNASTAETKPLWLRTSDGRGIADMRGNKNGYNAGQNEASLTFRLAVGGWGYQSALQFQTASPPRTYCYGELSANSVTNRSDARLKDSESPLDPQWIEAMLTLPVQTYMMGDEHLPPSEDAPEGRLNPARRQHIGFYAQDLLAVAPQAQAQAAVFANQDDILEYDLGSMLALAIHTIQHLNTELGALRARVDALESRP